MVNGTKPSKSANGQYDTGDHEGGTFLLTLVQDAAQHAPIPYLQEAAASVLYIFNAIAATKNNKEDFQRLADNAVALIAAIWRSYQISNNKNEWPSRALRDIILDLVVTLDSIVQFVKSRISKPWAFRVVYNVIDSSKLLEYRERLTSAVQKFQVSSDLNMNEMLLEVLKKQDQMWNHMQTTATSSEIGELRSIPQFEAPFKLTDSDMQKANLTREDIPNVMHEGSSRFSERVSRLSEAEFEDYPTGYRSRLSSNPMSFKDIRNSGISIGGGSVHIVNG